MTVRSDLAKYLREATPKDDQRPANDGTYADVLCGLQGRFVFDGGPSGRLYVIYGRVGPRKGTQAGEIARSRAADHISVGCSRSPSPVALAYDYAQTCVDDDPVLHQATGVAEKGNYVVVTLFIDGNGRASPATLRSQIAKASQDLAVQSLRRLTS